VGLNYRADGVNEEVIYVVEEQVSPSTDFFVLPAVSASSHRVVRCSFADSPTRDELRGAAVVFVRYVPANWAKLVESVHKQLNRLVFFMDDDVLDLRASTKMPWPYRLKLARLAAGRAPWLRRHGAEFWVSTAYLQRKYARWHPVLVSPFPVARPQEMRRVFYHGTASHAAEKRWLRPVIEEVLQRDERVAFEIVGGQGINRLYRGLPRVNVVHQMKWPAYQAFLSIPGRHLGVAPTLNTPFNRARSYTKFFDITCCGAVGIYSPGSAYAEVVTDGVDGLIVELEHEAWVEAILNIVRNEPLRRAMLRNAETKSARLANDVRSGHSALMWPEGRPGRITVS